MDNTGKFAVTSCFNSKLGETRSGGGSPAMVYPNRYMSGQCVMFSSTYLLSTRYIYLEIGETPLSTMNRGCAQI
jgi:hypothetical protein